jgi:hypothetical protein
MGFIAVLAPKAGRVMMSRSTTVLIGFIAKIVNDQSRPWHVNQVRSWAQVFD